MKLNYALVTLALGVMAFGATAEETNLMADWAAGQSISGTDGVTENSNWYAYNSNDNTFNKKGDGWAFRDNNGGNPGNGQIGCIFFRWNSDNSPWYYAWKFQAIEDHDYTLTLKAQVNEQVPNCLYIGAVADMAKAIDSKKFESWFESKTSNNSMSEGRSLTYKFTASSTGDYYVFFGHSYKSGNSIIKCGEFNLVDNGAHQYTADEYAAVVADAKALLENADYANVTGTEKTTLATLANAEGTPDDLGAAIKALNTAMNTFKAAKVNYDKFAEMKAKAKADNVYPLYKDAAEQYQTPLNLVLVDPKNATEAQQAATEIEHFVAEAIIGNVTGAGTTIPVPDALMPTEGDFPTTWTRSYTAGTKNHNQTGVGDNTIRRNAGEQPNVWNFFTAYYDTNEWGTSENWGAGLEQELQLSAGTYTLAVMARSAADLAHDFTLYAGDKSVELPKTGNFGNTLGLGWALTAVQFDVVAAQSETPANMLREEAAKVPVKIGVKINTTDNKQGHWFSFNNFRLVQNSNVPSGIAMTVADEDVPAVYYNLNGVRMDGSNLTPGVYVVRRGLKASKILVK